MGDSVTLRFLIDEDVPCSTTRVLRDAGFDVINVHEAGLQGKSDDLVLPLHKARTACLSPVTWVSRTF
jgi:hypothetical protein